MKHLSRAIIAVFMAILMGTLFPVQVFADTPDYIGEIKVYEGNCKNAENEGYTILCDDDGKPIDLNNDSGSDDIGAKGDKSVYLGYKTTKKKSEAITDLALMNMKGGYDVAEYEKLMAGQMSQQIVPFVESFLAAINEYRENYNSDNAENKGRAQFVHDALNKLTDDDCGGAGLGDLFLNETVYEMAKPKYEALSDKEKEKKSFYDVNNEVRDSLPEAEKNKHADILTIVAQSNGKATLMMQNLLTRAADTSDDTWLERFEGTTFDDLLDAQGGSPTDAMKKLAKKYDDDAQKLLEMWDAFRDCLASYDEYVAKVDAFDENAATEQIEHCEFLLEQLHPKYNKEEYSKFFNEYNEIRNQVREITVYSQFIAIHDYLESIDYEDGTLLDFFMMEYDEINDDLTILYPLIASLSKGQRAGLEFLSLKELFSVAMTDENGYSDIEFDEIEEISIYDGVDRGIYQKGGVALTSDAMRADALAKMNQDNSIFSAWTTAMIVLTATTFVAFTSSAVSLGIMKYDISSCTKEVSSLSNDIKPLTKGLADDEIGELETLFTNEDIIKGNKIDALETQAVTANSSICKGLAVGLGVAVIVLAAVTTYLSYRDMKAHYNVDFTPIPHYMVDEKDITGYNSKGEQIILKNQGAYYKAVECNRKKGDDYFGKIDTCADMNGCVNPQWLALYAAKNEAEDPILADSFKVVVGSTAVPQGYETGIHFFGEGAAFNLNDKRFCWNEKAKSVMVYYKTDKTAATTTGSNFTGGTLALAGGGGVLLGAAVTALGMTAARKRKENSAVTA